MLGDKDLAANVAVRDLDKAMQFYTGILGLTEDSREGNALVTLRSGSTCVNVYVSDAAGSNEATALTWEVDDVRGTVDGLKAQGVAFEHYDDMGMERDGDLHDGGDYWIAWFRDPDGNILNVVGGK